jgi:hypothetical protein
LYTARRGSETATDLRLSAAEGAILQAYRREDYKHWFRVEISRDFNFVCFVTYIIALPGTQTKQP